MHLSTEEPAASWMFTRNCLEKLVEVFLNTFHREKFSINDVVKSYHEKTVLKSLQLEFSSVWNKTNSTNFYPPAKGYLRETCKLQNKNPIYMYLNLKFTFGIIQIINKKNILTSTQFQYLTFQPNPRGQACVKIQSVTLHVDLQFFHFNLICNMTTFRKEKN